MADVTEKIISIEIKAGDAVNGIASLNKQIAENREEMKKLAQSNQKGSVEYAKLEQKTKALAAEKRVLQREVQNEVKLETEARGSLQSLRAELSKATQAYDRLSRAERVVGQRGEELRAKIQTLTYDIKEAEYETERYQRNVGNYTNSILGALGLNGRFASSIINITNMQSSVSNTFTSMGASVKAFGASLMSLMSNPVFLGIAGIVGAGMAFKWFYDYNVAVEKATRLTREFTGVTGAELTHLRAEIQATASTYDKDFKEVLEGVDLLMSHFHITSGEAIDTINKGFAAGADINGNYLELLKQYAPVFKDAGFSAEQLVALIQQTRSGIFSQQGLEAIKQASARIREMSKSTRSALQGIGIDVDDLQMKLRTNQIEMADAIKLVSAQLKTLPDNAQEVGEVMSAVFGRQGKFSSQEMIEGLADIDTNLDNLIEKAGEYGKALDQNQKATAALEEESAKLFGVGENGWETMKTRADTLWKTTLANIIKKVRELLVQFAEMGRRSQVFRTVAQVIFGAIASLNGAIIDIFRGTAAAFKAMGAWVDAFVTTFKSAFTIIRDLGKGVASILTGDVAQGISEITTGLNKGVNNALKGISTALGATAKVAHDATTRFRTAYNAAGEFFDKYQGATEWTKFGGGGDGGGDLLDDDNNDNNTNGAGGKGGSKGGGGKSGTAKTISDMEKRAKELIKKSQELQKRAMEAEAKESINGINKLALMQKAAFLAAYGDREQYEGQAQKAYDAMWQDIETKRQKAVEEFEKKQAKEREQQLKKAHDEAQKLVQTMMDGQVEGSAEELKYRLQLLQMQMDAELALYEDNESMKTAIVQKYNKQRNDITQEYAAKQREIEVARVQAAQQTTGALSELAAAFGDDSKEALALSKMLAVGEVMLAQAVAIANAVKAGSNAVNPWQMIAQIATSVTAVTVAMANAFKSLDEAKFATGGYIRGAGTSTSDSIPVRVSNGESIMNANTTAMFGGLLSSLNQLGGGVPIQVAQTAQSVRGEDMLARAVARGVAMLPAPVVSVQDINQGQRQVEVLTERARL